MLLPRGGGERHHSAPSDSTVPVLFLPYDAHFFRETWNRRRSMLGNLEQAMTSESATTLPPSDSRVTVLFLPYDAHFCRETWNMRRGMLGNLE